jgi:hypothetical protein
MHSIVQVSRTLNDLRQINEFIINDFMSGAWSVITDQLINPIHNEPTKINLGSK